MIPNIKQYQKTVSDIAHCATGLLAEEQIQQFQEHITTKLSEFKPTMMIYGTYNSGKSTLLNALFGKVRAKTADIPETAVIQPYEFYGFTIYDTPGINAPIEHEKLSREHLEKCELVLFVLSNDGSFEEEFIYKEICQIVIANKPLLIVLNNKRNTASSSSELKVEMEKININLSIIGDREGIERIEDKVTLMMVDARTALEGKLEQIPELIEESQIENLERKIVDALKQAGSAEIINALSLYVRKFSDNLLSEIDSKLDTPEMQQIESLLTFVEKFKNKNKLELNNDLHQRMNVFQYGLQERLLDNTTKEEEIMQYIYSTIDDFVSLFEQKGSAIEQELSSRLAQFEVEMDAIQVNYEKIQINKEYGGQSADYAQFTEAFTSVLKNKDTVSKVTKEAFLKLRESKILFKGKWERTLERYAGKFANVVNVAVGVYEIHNAIKEHNHQVEEQRRRVLWAKNQAEEIALNLKNDLSLHTEGIMNSIFDELITTLRTDYNNLSKNNSTLLNTKKTIQQLTATIDSNSC